MNRRSWCGRVLLEAVLGLVLALAHALYLAATAPVPGAYPVWTPFLLAENSRTWGVVPAWAFGVRQYTVTPDVDVDGHPLGPLQPRPVPRWVLRPPSGEYGISRGFGWPLVALSGTEIYATSNHQLLATPGYLLARRQRFIPVQVQWGLLVNSALFGVLALGCICLLTEARAKLRSALAARTGACRECGYDMTGVGSVCPECGHTDE